jgi:catechol 2,3-dioxygenase-like lactoylglutathione lyase family enzyme
MRTARGRILTIVALLGFPSVQTLGGTPVEISDVRGVQEMLVSVADLDRSAALYQRVAGWRVIYEGVADPAQMAFWGLNPKAPVQQMVLGNPGSRTGLLRLVRFVGVEQLRIRSSARPFDSGAIFNINSLVKNLDFTFEALRREGFQGFSDPNYYEIFGKRYGGAMLRGHDGVVINLLQRVDDNYADQPPFVTMSNINNATQVVADYQTAREFFTAKLGWTVRWEAAPEWAADGANNMGLPNSLLMAGAVKEQAASFRLDPESPGGTIEIFHFQGITGVDFSKRAHPPNLGVLMYTVHTAGLCGYLADIAARGVTAARGPASFRLAPYGRVLGAIVVAPDGAWLQFIDQTNKDLACDIPKS